MSGFKKYVPYALIIFAVYLLVPLVFLIPALSNYSTVAYYFIFLVTQVVCSAAYCAKQGLDFLFALIAPIAFIPSVCSSATSPSEMKDASARKRRNRRLRIC